MPIYEYHCQKCGNFEIVCSIKDYTQEVECACGGMANRVFTISGPNCSNQDADWLRKVLPVVEKNSGKAHCERFLKEPTRDNYRAWMKGEGIRPMENGEKSIYRKSDKEKQAMDRALTNELVRLKRKRETISIG